jgi:hypothetical protein
MQVAGGAVCRLDHDDARTRRRGLALFGGPILAAGAAVVVAGFSGVRHLRRLVSQRSHWGHQVVQLGRGEYDYDAPRPSTRRGDRVSGLDGTGMSMARRLVAHLDIR